MKKIIETVLCFVLVLALSACEAKLTKNESSITTVKNQSSHDESNVSNNNFLTVQAGISNLYLCELYLEVLEDLWNVDSALNDGISRIGINLSELSDLTEEQKDYVMSHFASKHNLPYIVGTWEELCKQGYIDKENLLWKDGLFFSIKTDEDAIKADNNGLEYTAFNAHKWRSGLGAYFFGQCLAQKNDDGTWSYTVGQEMIS